MDMALTCSWNQPQGTHLYSFLPTQAKEITSPSSFFYFLFVKVGLCCASCRSNVIRVHSRSYCRRRRWCAANVTASWGEFKSPEGHTYYYNSITKESSWTQPAGYQPHAAVGAAAAAGSAASASGASTAAVVDSNGASRTSGGQQLTYDQLLDQERIRKAGSQGDAGAAEDELPGPPEKKAKKDDADGFFKQDEKTNCFMYIQGLPTEVSKC